jgi:diguanylate cyclase (GGDEF)-like protein
VTVSLGAAAAVPDAGSRPEELVTRADRALYRAKAAGRNHVETDRLD